jgi:hypothetical protein
LVDLSKLAHQLGIKVILTGLMGDVLNDTGADFFYDLLAQKKLGTLINKFGWDWQHNYKRAIFSLVFDGLFPFFPTSLHKYSLEIRAKQQTIKLSNKIPSYVKSSWKDDIISADQKIILTQLQDIYSPSAVRRTTLTYLYPPPVALTMAFPQPIERRHPYCDRRLVELVLSMPAELKWDSQYKGRVAAGRSHHRKALKSQLPHSIINDRVSVDFTPALNKCVNSQLVQDWLKQSSTMHIIEKGYVDGDLWQKNLENSFKLDKYLIAFLSLEFWLRFLEK